MKRTRGILAALLVLFGTGCFEIEQSIELKRDLSGTANFKLGVDMEPMVIIMARVQKEMSGDKSPLTATEIAAAKADSVLAATARGELSPSVIWITLAPGRGT